MEEATYDPTPFPEPMDYTILGGISWGSSTAVLHATT